jgi:hypothetical protein
MPAPTTFGTIVTNIDPTAFGDGRYVADGEKWGGGLGTGVTLTFSFPGTGSNGNFANYSNPYPDAPLPTRMASGPGGTR